ncbi:MULTISPECIES: hypothetical protein [unclassified Variovorax]|uniref:hypothetical protein n=1 Tax=unclassified Variovorax TaxID=663243 RepID=UPI0011AF7FD0|nr:MULTISPECIES: hypothetical protein [unclassified Variovorax]
MKAIEINKTHLSLTKGLTDSLQAAVRNERTLDEIWIKEKGWRAIHLDDSNLVRFTASTLIRYTRSQGFDRLYAVDTVDLFRSIYGEVDVRIVPMTLDGISQACFGLPRAEEGNPDSCFEWFLQKAMGVSVFFPMTDPIPMLVMRDASTCITIAGDDFFLDCMVRGSRRIWYEGVPHDGLSRRKPFQSEATQRQSWMC